MELKIFGKHVLYTPYAGLQEQNVVSCFGNHIQVFT